MPEQLTRHPEITLKVLKSAGAKCGEGAEQRILKACPADRFCRLPRGEICVYGLEDAPRMTQIKPADWESIAAATVPAAQLRTASSADFTALGIAALVLGLVLGFAIARLAIGPRTSRRR